MATKVSKLKNSVCGGSLAQESGLSVGDEILSIGKDKVPKDCDEQILSKIIRRQDQFPPPICVVSRVKYVELDLGIDEKIGFQVKKLYNLVIRKNFKT